LQFVDAIKRESCMAHSNDLSSSFAQSLVVGEQLQDLRAAQYDVLRCDNLGQHTFHCIIEEL
jgi:hypothetical protein